jgi:hypothetical protein
MKSVTFTFNKCKDCPYFSWEADDNWMGGNGWEFCDKLNKRLELSKYVDDKFIRWEMDKRCPLPDVPVD